MTPVHIRTVSSDGTTATEGLGCGEPLLLTTTCTDDYEAVTCPGCLEYLESIKHRAAAILSDPRFT